MSRKLITETHEIEPDDIFDGSIEDVINRLRSVESNLINSIATIDVSSGVTYHWNYCHDELQITTHRFETESEFNARMRKEEQQFARREAARIRREGTAEQKRMSEEARARQHYEALKIRFGDA